MKWNNWLYVKKIDCTHVFHLKMSNLLRKKFYTVKVHSTIKSHKWNGKKGGKSL